MASKVWILLCVLVFVAPLPAQTALDWYCLSPEGLVLRAGPSTQTAKLATIPFQDRVSLLKSDHQRTRLAVDNLQGSFEKVLWRGKIGYVFSGYLVPALFSVPSPKTPIWQALKPYDEGDQTYVLPVASPQDFWVLLTGLWNLQREDGKVGYPTDDVWLKGYGEPVRYGPSDGKDEPGLVFQFEHPAQWNLKGYSLPGGGVKLVLITNDLGD